MNKRDIKERRSLNIDYLSLDIDEVTNQALNKIPLNKIQFSVITIEHDWYRNKNLKSEQRNILESNGYIRVCSDVKSEGLPFEDWYINKNLNLTLDPCSDMDHQEIIKKYNFSSDRSEILKNKNSNLLKVNDYFDKVFCINLDRRTDRWELCKEQFERFDLEVERFSGICGLRINVNGVDMEDGNAGCTESHRAILDKIVDSNWKRVLILEDDFRIVYDDFIKKFSNIVKLVPNDWDMLYLGGHYAEPPIKRINEHVIKHARMLTTSSYGITKEFADKIRKDIYGHGPIDSLYGGHHADNNCYILQPRLIVQRESYSDLQNKIMDNENCMGWPPRDANTRHEKMV